MMIEILQIIILILELIAKGVSEENAITNVCRANNVNVDLIRKMLKK